MPQSLARTAHASPFAVAVCTTYFVTGIAYVLARAAASRDALAAGLHPPDLWYSAAVLAVELLSIVALTIHGIAAATEPHDTPTAECGGCIPQVRAAAGVHRARAGPVLRRQRGECAADGGLPP